MAVAFSPLHHKVPAFLRNRGYQCVTASSIEDAIDLLGTRDFAFTVVDLRGDPDNAELIPRLRLQPGRSGPIIGLANGANGHGLSVDVDDIAGLDHLIRTPVGDDEYEQLIRLGGSGPANGLAAMGAGPGKLEHEIGLWHSPAMRDVRAIIEEAACVDVTVLITGETGTGKDVVARAIHSLSPRLNGPFVKVNCAAVPRELLESELFGHERGAFTGAHKLKVGKFELAQRGTLFLDEIGDLHSALQAKLLHVLQDGSFSRVGGKTGLKTDVRVLAATNQDLERAVAEGRFREDLYYRLNVIQIAVPPLRERVDDITGLVEYFVQLYSPLFHREGFTLPASVLEQILQQRYPGNVRELENLIKRMIVLRDPYMLRSAQSHNAPGPKPVAAPAAIDNDFSLRDVVRKASMAAEREAIARVLDQTGWNRVRAAKALKISYRALLYKMKRVGLRGVRLAPAQPTWPLKGESEGWSA